MHIVAPQFIYIYITCGIVFILSIAGIILSIVLSQYDDTLEITESDKRDCSGKTCWKYVEINVTRKNTVIDNFCRSGCNMLQNIWLDNITTINNNYCADAGCNILQNSWLGNVVTIGDNFCYDSTHVFGSCLQMTMMNISNLQSIGQNFCGNIQTVDCLNLKSIMISKQTGMQVIQRTFIIGSVLDIFCLDQESYNICQTHKQDHQKCYTTV